MRTTLNLPEAMVRDAKMRALREGFTLTDLLVQGLKQRLEKRSDIRLLPVSRAVGGLCSNVDWSSLCAESGESEQYR